LWSDTRRLPAVGASSESSEGGVSLVDRLKVSCEKGLEVSYQGYHICVKFSISASEIARRLQWQLLVATEDYVFRNGDVVDAGGGSMDESRGRSFPVLVSMCETLAAGSTSAAHLR